MYSDADAADKAEAARVTQAGMRAIMDDEKVFACHKSMQETIHYSELGSSLAILNAGFNLDCLMLRYQGVDWRRAENWNCNAR